jgi:hypothetical protein
MDSKGRRTLRTAAPADPAAPHRVEGPEPAPVDVPATEPRTEVVAERIAQQAQPATTDAPTAPVKPTGSADKGRDLFELMTESRSAMIRTLASLSDEFASLTQRSIDTAAQTAIGMLAVKTWADAVAINSGFARTSLDQWFGGTAKVSELGVKFAIESSEPFVAKLTKVLSEARPGR